MATLVFFHAHPDDESILTGGSIARAADEGHRVVLVVATDGRLGEVPDDLGTGESLVDRRRAELARSADVLGVRRVEWLGYHDSGMTGWEQNDDPASFHRADLDEAAGRLAAILADERTDVLVTYDWHGNYGHPDHIKVHRVGHRAAELAGTPQVFEATMNRDDARRGFEEMRAAGMVLDAEEDWDVDGPMDDGNPMGTPEAELTMVVDVSPYVGRKRAAIAAHRSQVTDSGFFLAIPDDVFDRAFGREWFVEHGVEPGVREGWLLAD